MHRFSQEDTHKFLMDTAIHYSREKKNKQKRCVISLRLIEWRFVAELNDVNTRITISNRIVASSKLPVISI